MSTCIDILLSVIWLAMM